MDSNHRRSGRIGVGGLIMALMVGAFAVFGLLRLFQPTHREAGSDRIRMAVSAAGAWLLGHVPVSIRLGGGAREGLDSRTLAGFVGRDGGLPGP